MQRRVVSILLFGVSGLAVPFAAQADCSVTGDDTLDCNGTIYRAVDDECTYYVDLSAHQNTHPGIPLPDLKKSILDNYAADAVPDPVAVELTDYVDCTQTDHNFSDTSMTTERPNKPSRLMNISGKTFRVTAWPEDGFDTMYYSYDVTLGGTAGVPHLLVAESSNDQERYTSLLVHHPDETLSGFPGAAWSHYDWAPPYTGEPTGEPWGSPWWSLNTGYTQQSPVFAPDVGLTTYTGRELPIDHQPFNISLIFHAKSTVTRIVVSSLGCNLNRSSTDGGAVSQMWVFAFVDAMSDRYPAHTLPASADEQRRIGIYMTHPWYLYAHNGTPVRTLSQRQLGLQRTVEHLAYCGMNYLVFNAINGADRSEKTWYDGSAHFDWNAAGDLLAELPPIAEAEGVELVPLITSLKDPTYTGGLSFSNDSYQMGSDGDFVLAFNNRLFDPLRPEVQQLTFNLLGEIASRCASSPAVRGIGIRVNGKIGTCYNADQDGWRGAKLAGYSSWDLQQFKNATGSDVPTSPPGTAYDWLRARPSEWESWINWRCEETRDFWLACRDLIRGYRSDLIFYVQCDLPSELPGTNLEWPGETPYNLLRHHGYDPTLFVNDTGIVISRGIMVALERFKHSGRWSAPWGSNYENYHDFHYAPGLAELYRTAEGRAAEMYQDYWEEAYNPYWEFGFPGQPTYFRTTTPAAPGRAFFEGAAMAVRRQDPDTITWLGWNRPTLGHENDLRKFAQAFRALPVVDPVPFNGTITPDSPDEVVARWYDDRLAVVNDTSSARTITLSFTSPLPMGEELIDVVTGRKLITTDQAERQNASFNAEAFSLNTFLHVEPAVPKADFTTDPLPSDPPLTVMFHDASVATNITSWDWDFGDSTTGAGPEPTHTYADFGTYNVTLTIVADEGPFDTTRPITLTPVPPPVPGVDNPSFEDNGGSLDGWEIVIVEGTGPDNPPWDDGNTWGVTPPDGTHFGGKITNGMKRSFYMGQAVGTSNYNADSTRANWQLDTWVQLHCTHEGEPNPTGVHQVWELGWNDDGSEPSAIMNCDHYEVAADLDATYTGNSQTDFFPLNANGAITGVADLRGVAMRIHLFNDAAWWWTFMNTDNVSFVVESAIPSPPDFDGDGDVDQDDFGVFQACITGPDRGPPTPGCEQADFDSDDDVDQADFGLLQRCYTGADGLMRPDCAVHP